MTQISNIRQLLTDPKLGLLPHLDDRLQAIEQSLKQQIDLQIAPYELTFGACNTVAANEPRPLITQLISLRFLITGSSKDTFEILLLVSELQNDIDAAILEWSNREWYQFEKPLKRPVTQIVGGYNYEFLEASNDSYRISVTREFDLTYLLTF
jgi:hypothetical protein